MDDNRIGYMDTFRGLCVCWIIWIHTSHPTFLDYPLHLPALFLISGCFFRPYPWPIFWRKKVNQLVIPFCFFYLLYYVFLIALNLLKYHVVSPEILTSVWDVFRPFSFNDGYLVNYPLWFIVALLILQFSTFGLVHIIKNRWLLLSIAIALSLVGSIYLRKIPLYFMMGRALSYFVYFMFGAVFGKNLMRWFEQNGKSGFLITAVLFASSFFILRFVSSEILRLLLRYVNFLSAACILALACYFMHFYQIAPVLDFVGRNALVVFGLHDMYLTICRILTQTVVGEMNNLLGFLNLLFVLLLMWPSILLLNKNLPHMVGKQAVFALPKPNGEKNGIYNVVQ